MLVHQNLPACPAVLGAHPVLLVMCCESHATLEPGLHGQSKLQDAGYHQEPLPRLPLLSAAQRAE